jgi:predicted metal-dependent peptidase
MNFNINNTEWKIKLVDEATINNEMKQDGTLGVTIYKTQEIMLLENQANIIKTLKHELMHVWLYEYEHPQDDESKYTYEDVCEIVASSNEFINEIVEQYRNLNRNDDYIDALRYTMQMKESKDEH